MTTARRLLVNQGKPLLPAQQALLMDKPGAQVRAMFGGYGSAKTRAGALATLQVALANPFDPARYERGDNPQTCVVGLTHKVLRDSAMREFFAVVPPELVLYHRKSPDFVTMLVNGHLILWRTVGGALEGNSLCGLWLDEASKLEDRGQLLNLMARVRDPRAHLRRIIVTGLPEYGLMQETFQPKELAQDPNYLVVHARTADNTYLPKDYLDNLRASIPSKLAAAYFEGQWMPAQGAAIYEYDPAIHLQDDRGDRAQLVHVALDVGSRGAVLFLQERDRRCKRQDGTAYTTRGLHVVDELLPERKAVREVARDIVARGWRIEPTRSLVFVDPNVDADELLGLRDALGDRIGIIRKTRGDAAYAIDYGLRCVNVALRDADNNVLLTFRRDLPRLERSLLTALPKYRLDHAQRAAIKDNRTDHVIDALRYAVAHLLPQVRGAVTAKDAR